MKIIIADDHAIIRQGLSFLIEEVFPNAEITYIDKLTNAMQVIKDLQADLLILDINIPGGNTLNLVEKMKLHGLNTRVLIFSAYDDIVHSKAYYKAGALGYLSKLSDDKEIKTALTEVMDGKKFYSVRLREHLLENIYSEEDTSINPFKFLSERELEVCRLIVKGHNIGEISRALNIKTSTASTYKQRLLEKLNVGNVVDLYELYVQFNRDQVD